MDFNWKDPITKCSWQPIQLWPASYNWLYTTTHWSELKWYYITNYLQELFFSLATTVKGHITHMIPSDEATIQSRERHAGQLATVRELGRMRWSCVGTHVRRINGKIHEFMLRIPYFEKYSMNSHGYFYGYFHGYSEIADDINCILALPVSPLYISV